MGKTNFQESLHKPVRSNRNVSLSIITVSFNAAKTLRSTINSVLSQKDVAWEYIIIDGGSTDGTVDIIKEHSDRLSYWVSERDSGIYDAMNKGIAQANGELVGIINSDDWYAPGVLKVIYGEHLKNPGAVIHGDMMLVSENGENLYSLTAPDYPSVPGEFKKMTVNHPATFVPRSLYEKHGAFDLLYQLSADYELIIRLLSKGIPFVPLHQVTSYFRLGGQSGGLETYKENFAIQRRYGRSIAGTSWWFGKAVCKLWIAWLMPVTLLDFLRQSKRYLTKNKAAV